MVSLTKLSFLFFFIVGVQASLLLSYLVHGVETDDDDDHDHDHVDDGLLQGINSHRASKGLAALIKHDKADCLADEISDNLEHTPCESPTNGANYMAPTSQPTTQLPSLSNDLRKCRIDVTTKSDGIMIIMPVCVPQMVGGSTQVVNNYTSSSRYARYLEDSRITGAGVGSEKSWTVLVLATSAQTAITPTASTIPTGSAPIGSPQTGGPQSGIPKPGSTANAAAGSLVPGFGSVHYLVSLLLGCVVSYFG